MSVGSPHDVTPSSPSKPLLRGWLHVAGALALVACSPLLFERAHTGAQVCWVLSFLVGVEAMFVTSAIFHRIRWSPARQRILRRADHAAIFLAITGSYIAIAGLTMHGNIRLILLATVFFGAGVGATIRLLTVDRPTLANSIAFVLVGWTAVAFLPQLYRGAGPLAFFLIAAGGLTYTVGAIAFGLKRPRLAPATFGYHEVFHVATLIGAGLTFWAIGLTLS